MNHTPNSVSRLKLYIFKIWDKLELSVIITILLCIFMIINSFMILGYVLTTDKDTILRKYYLWNSVILYCLVILHSSELYTSMFKYINFQESSIAVTFLLSSFVIILDVLITAYAILDDSSNVVYFKNIDYTYIVYSVALYVFVTEPFSIWKVKFNRNNIGHFLGNYITKKDLINNYCCKISTFLMICHTVLSLILLNAAYIINSSVTIYYIISIISIIFSIIVVTCEITHNDTYSYKPYFAAIIVYIIIAIVNFFLFIPYKGIQYMKTRNIFFIIQGAIIFFVVLLIIMCTVYTMLKKFCGNIKNEIDTELGQQNINENVYDILNNTNLEIE